MLKALKFVQGSVAKKDLIPALQHFRIKDGVIKGYNGNLSLCCPIALDLDVTPKAIPFIKAVETCRDTVSMSVSPAGKLAIKSGKFKALIDCEATGVFPDLQPEGEHVNLAGGLLPVLKKLLPFIADDASRQWARGILLKGNSAFVTNNIVVIEYWLGTPFPLTVNIPRSAVLELLRIGEEPIAAQFTDASVSFHFEGGGWMRTQTFDQGWPDLAPLLNKESNQAPVPEGLFEAAADLAPFVEENGALYLLPKRVSTTASAETGARLIVPSLDVSAVFHKDHLLSLAGVITTIDLALYPRPCLFRGEMLRGALVGIRVPETLEAIAPLSDMELDSFVEPIREQLPIAGEQTATPVVNNGRTVIVIPCCGEKLKVASPAGEIYQSNLYKKLKALAVASDCDWYIFSAKHGLLHPDTVIEPYDLVIKLNAGMTAQAKKTGYLTPVADKNHVYANKQAANKILAQYGKRIYLMGEAYCEHLIEGHRPLKGMGIGKQIGYVTKATPQDIGAA